MVLYHAQCYKCLLLEFFLARAAGCVVRPSAIPCIRAQRDTSSGSRRTRTRRRGGQSSSTLSRRRNWLLVVRVWGRARLEHQRRDILLVVARRRSNPECAVLLRRRHEMVQNHMRRRRQDGVVVDRLGRLRTGRAWLGWTSRVRVEDNLFVSARSRSSNIPSPKCAAAEGAWGQEKSTAQC